MRIFTDYEINDIIKTYKNTGSLTKTSEKHNTTNGKIKALLTKYANIIDFSLLINIDDKIKSDIITDYTINNLSIEDFEVKYGLLKDTLIKNLKSWGIKPNRAHNSGKIGKRKLIPEQEKEICRLYTEEKLSTWKIAPKFNVLNVCILQVLRRNNVQTRTRSKAAREYNLDESYFENINTPEKAYFLGLLYAEGHLETEGRNTITLSLCEEDKYIVEWLQKELKSDRPLEYRPKKQEHHNNAYVLRISSLKFMGDLEKLGLPIGNKSHIIIFPDFLNKDLYKYFLLSYFDGDGCTGIYDNYLYMNFSGNIMFMEGIKNYLYTNLNIKSNLYHRNKTTAVLEMSQYDSIRLFNWLYEDIQNLPIFMVRKFKIFSNFAQNRLEWLNKRTLSKMIWKKILLEKSLKIIKNIESSPKFFYLLN